MALGPDEFVGHKSFVGQHDGRRAERQARGEDVLTERTEEEEVAVNAEALFEEGAGPKAEEESAEAE